MKKFWLVFVLILAFSFTGCGKKEKAAPDKTQAIEATDDRCFAISLEDYTERFNGQVPEGLAKAEADGFKVRNTSYCVFHTTTLTKDVMLKLLMNQTPEGDVLQSVNVEYAGTLEEAPKEYFDYIKAVMRSMDPAITKAEEEETIKAISVLKPDKTDEEWLVSDIYVKHNMAYNISIYHEGNLSFSAGVSVE